MKRSILLVCTLVIFSTAADGASIRCTGETRLSAPPCAADRSDGTSYLAYDGHTLSIGANKESLTEVPAPQIRTTDGSITEDVTLRIALKERTWAYTFTPKELRTLRSVRLPKGILEVTVEAPHHDPVVARVSTDTGNATFPRVTLRAHPRLSGIVLDANTHLPLPGATIVNANEKSISVTSGGDGRFNAFVPPDEWTTEVGISYPGRGTRWIVVPSRIADADLGSILLTTAGTLRIVLPQKLIITAVDLDEQARDQRVRMTRKRIAVAPDQDVIVVSDIVPGPYSVVLHGTTPLELLAVPVIVDADRPTVIAPTITPMTLHVTARLRNDPIPATTIYVRHSPGEWETEVTLDERGSFEGAVWQEGTLLGNVVVPQHTTPYFTTKAIAFDSPNRWEITIGGQILTGTIVDATTKERIKGARVMLRSEYEDGASTKIIRTNEDGSFVIEYLRVGRHTITANSPRYLQATVSFQTLPGDTERSLTVELAKGVTRRLLVLNGNGAPAGKAEVLDGRGTPAAVTDASGHANIAIPEGTAKIVFVIPKEGAFAIVPLDPEDQREELTVAVPPPTTTITVRTETTQGGALPNVGLLTRYNGIMLPLEVLQSLDRVQSVTFKTARDGTAILRGLPAGLYDFWPIFDYSRIDETIQFPGASVVSIAAQPGENLVVLTFKKSDV